MIILIICVIFIIIILLCMTISVKIQIKNLRFSFPKSDGRYTNRESEIYLKVYLLKKILIAKIDLKKLNSKNKKISSKLQQRVKNQKFNINSINFLKNNHYILEEMDLKICFGIEDAALTAIVFGLLNTVLGNFFGDKITDINFQKFEIVPIYNCNILKIKFDGIFTFKMANIIGIIKYLKKRSVDNNGRTSYRRSYAYSNE